MEDGLIVERDASNYCEIEVAPQYDVAWQHDQKNTKEVAVREFEPYSELELSQPPPSQDYSLTSTSRDQSKGNTNDFLPQVTGCIVFDETYSVLDVSANNEYDTTAQKGPATKADIMYPASDTQGFNSCYSNLEGLPYTDYDTTSHTKKEQEQIKLLGTLNPDVYSSVELSHGNYDVTSPINKGSIQ